MPFNGDTFHVKPVVAVSVPASALDAGQRTALADYAELLASAGVERGLIGPREVPRLWERHLENCAVVALSPVVPSGARVADVGSGAGLPGLVWAIVRPDIQVTLIESMQRRCDFLREAVGELGLDTRVDVVRGRAEEQEGRWELVTARAVAPLAKLTAWTWPVVASGGSLVAMKGSRAADEITEAAVDLRTRGILEPGQNGFELLRVESADSTATVVRLKKEAPGRGK